MKYLKIYLLTHLKYWWIYILAFFTLMLGLLVVVITVGRSLDAMKVNHTVNLVLSSCIAALIGSIPVLFVNRKVAENYQKHNIVLAAIINQMIIIIFFYIIAHISLYWLIIDFRS